MIIITLIILFVCIFILKYLSERSVNGDESTQKVSNSNISIVAENYFAKKRFFTDSEFAFFNILKEENIHGHTILSKVRFEDLLEQRRKVIGGRGYVKSRHIDFVIVSKDSGDIAALIELDGKSHNDWRQRRLDEKKNTIALHAFGNKFFRIPVGSDFRAVVREILRGVN